VHSPTSDQSTAAAVPAWMMVSTGDDADSSFFVYDVSKPAFRSAGRLGGL
jgi:hypothetical protein